MKISDLFGDNKSVSTINFYCQVYGITMPENELYNILAMLQENARFCVFISKLGCETLRIDQRSELVGKIVGGRVKRGTVLFFHDGAYRVVTPENWRETWKMLVPKPERIVDDRIIVPKRKRTIFDEGLPDRVQKKAARRGFERTYIANESITRMQILR